MQRDPDPPKPLKAKPSSTQIREERLKAALKANMARRKAQAKAKAGMQGGDNEIEGE